jgi:hypothetical protein
MRLTGEWLVAGLVGLGAVALVGYDVGSRALGCDVKGNISSAGERIYHVPGQEYYSRTTINWLKGERMFCSEGAARQGGWRRAKL